MENIKPLSPSDMAYNVKRQHEIRAKVLDVIYNLCLGSRNTEISIDVLLKEVSLHEIEVMDAVEYLHSEGMIESAIEGERELLPSSYDGHVYFVLTREGRREVEQKYGGNFMAHNFDEKLVEQVKFRHQQKVGLLTLAYERTSVTNQGISLYALSQEQGISETDLRDILEKMEEDGLVEFTSNEAVFFRLTPQGKRQCEGIIFPDLLPPQPSSTINNNFQVDNHGQLQIGGSRNYQAGIIQNHSQINDAVAKLTEVLKAAPLAELEKEDVLEAVEKLKNLAKKEPSEGVTKRAKEKLDLIKNALEVAEKLTPYLAQAVPYLSTLAQRFHLPPFT